MGGKNHQPCGRYLQNSTLMSRSMSLAQVDLELANVALEDLILAELDGNIGDIVPIKTHLDESLEHLAGMQRSIDTLSIQMDTEKYVDLPPMKTMDLLAFGRAMRAAGLHRSESAWNNIAAIMQKSGFVPTLQHHAATLSKLVSLTKDLKTCIQDSTPAAAVGKLNVELEENRALNFKAEFARVYTAWADFQQEFLASSMISTEVWYRHNNSGSLLDFARGVRAA